MFIKKLYLTYFLGVFAYFHSLIFFSVLPFFSIIYFIFVLIFFVRSFYIDNRVIFFIYIIVSIQVIFNLISFSPIIGPDESHFYTTAINYDFSQLVQSEIDRVSEYGGFIKSRTTYSAFLNILIPVNLSFAGAEIILLLNLFFFFFGVLLYLKSIEFHLGTRIIQISFCLFMLSPSFLFWSANFGKDIISISLCLMAASFYLSKRFLIFTFLLLAASMIRPYSVVMVFLYVAPFVLSLKSILFALISALFIFGLVMNFSIISFINIFIANVYMYLSPNPASLGNWSVNIDVINRFNFSPALTFEGIIISVLMFLYIFYQFLKGQDKYFKKLFFCVLIGACVLTLVGNFRLNLLNEPINIGSMGDNMLRKKTIVLPLILIMVSCFLSKIKFFKSFEVSNEGRSRN